MSLLSFDPGAGPLTFTNHTGADIDKFAVFAVEQIEYDADGFFTCHAVLIDATTVAGNNLFALNTGNVVADGKTGKCYLALHQAAWAKVDPYLVESDVTPSGGNYVEIGPVSGVDYLKVGGSGFLVVGGKYSAGAPVNGRLLVIQRQSELVAAKITETGDSGLNTTIYRTSHPYGFNVKRLDSSLDTVGDDITCYADLMKGVHWTNALIWMFRWGGKWQVVNTGAFFWSQHAYPSGAVALEDIGIGTFGQVELWSGGPIVDAWASWDVASGQAVDVQFDDQQQIFVITGVSCP